MYPISHFPCSATRGRWHPRGLYAFTAAAVLMVTASAGCFGPAPLPSSNPDCPDGGGPLVPIQVNVSNWTDGVVTFTVRAVCRMTAMMPGNLSYIVRSANGTVFLNGTAGTGPEVLGARVALAFADANATGSVDRGDIFTLSIDPPERSLLLGGGRVYAYNDSRHFTFLGLAKIPFPTPPHVGLSLSSHSLNITTITVISVEGLPPTPFDELQITIYTRNNAKAWAADVSYRDADADSVFSAGDQLVVSVDPSHPSEADQLTGGRIEVSFFGRAVGTLGPLP